MDTILARSLGCPFVLALLLASVPAGAQRAPLWELPVEGHPDATWSYAAIDGQLAFVSGSELADQIDEGHDRGLIAALDTRTGERVWVEEADTATGQPPAGGTGRSFLGPLAVSNRVVVAGGFRDVNDQDTSRVGVIRAYDQKIGTLLWDKRLPGASYSDTRTMVAAVGRRVFVAMNVGEGPDGSAFIAGYDIVTGAELWDHSYEDPYLYFVAITAAGRYAVVTGFQVTAGISRLMVRVHDARSGELLWNEIDLAYGAAASNDALSIRGNRLIVGASGYEPASNTRDELTIAYDLRRRRPLWALPLQRYGNQQVVSVAATGAGIFSLVFDQPGLFEGSRVLLVRALDPRTGALRWDEEVKAPTFGAFRVVEQGRRVVVACPDGVFAFDSRTGEPVWNAALRASDVAIGGKYVVVPGGSGVAGLSLR